VPRRDFNLNKRFTKGEKHYVPVQGELHKVVGLICIKPSNVIISAYSAQLKLAGLAIYSF
jgi:hypothetical protein